MFLEFYGLQEQPFGVTPDPRFLYLSPAHREALASLYYGIEAGRGFMAMIAKPGMGKTTLLFQLLDKLRGHARTAFIFQTQCNSREFMRFLLGELGIETQEQDFVRMHDEFNRLLLQEAREGRRFIIVIDEAQNLEPSVLETVRLLSDFETPRAKLLQIILAGQPELADKLVRPALHQLSQRISILSRLDPLSPEECVNYVSYRLRIAGCKQDIFTPRAQQAIAELSGGIPRVINNICFNALSLGCALGQNPVDAGLVEEVAADTRFTALTSGSHAYGPGAIVDTRAAAPDVSTPAANASPLPPAVPNDMSVSEAQAYLQEFADGLKGRPAAPASRRAARNRLGRAGHF